MENYHGHPFGDGSSYHAEQQKMLQQQQTRLTPSPSPNIKTEPTMGAANDDNPNEPDHGPAYLEYLHHLTGTGQDRHYGRLAGDFNQYQIEHQKIVHHFQTTPGLKVFKDGGFGSPYYGPAHGPATVHRPTGSAMKENHGPSSDLPFREVNWHAHPSSDLTVRQQNDAYHANALNQYAGNQFANNTPPPPPATRPGRAATISYPVRHIPTPALRVTIEEEDEYFDPTGPLNDRRASLPGPRTAEGLRLHRKQKREWKKQLELNGARYAAEQEELFTAAREGFSPEVDGKSVEDAEA
ncbi:MAG: hypothetical protein Q9184_001589 [Pyrenodesmia sp. 2 TL-2023]